MHPSENSVVMQVLHFRVSEAAVNGVTCVKGQELILAASADTSVHMYNYKGGLVGTFGIHEWILDDVATHQDPDAHNTLPVLDPVEALCSVAAVRDAVPGAPTSILCRNGRNTFRLQSRQPGFIADE